MKKTQTTRWKSLRTLGLLLFFITFNGLIFNTSSATPLLQDKNKPEVADERLTDLDEDVEEFKDAMEFDQNDEDDAALAANNPWGIDPQQMAAAKRFHLTQTFLVEVEQIDAVCKLDEKQRMKLRVGAKGAVKKLLAEWNRTSAQQMGIVDDNDADDDDADDDEEAAEEVANNANQKKNKKAAIKPEPEIKDADEIDENVMQFVVMDTFGNPFTTKQPMDSPIWKKMMASVLTKDQLIQWSEHQEKLAARKKAAMISFVLETLVIEVGLDEGQREEIRKLIEPPLQKSKISCATFYEAYVMYYYASQVKDRELKKCLTPAQLQKWKLFMAPAQQIGQMIELQDEADFEAEFQIVEIINFSDFIFALFVEFDRLLSGIGKMFQEW